MARAPRLWIAAVLALLIVGGGTAYAASSGVVWTYRSTMECVSASSLLTPSSSGGGVNARSWLWSDMVFQIPPAMIYCSIPFDRPAGYIQTRMLLYKSIYSPPRWALVADSGPLFNRSTAWQQSWYWDWRGNSPWGAGTYGFYGGGWVYNGAWHGGPLWSGNQWFSR